MESAPLGPEINILKPRNSGSKTDFGKRETSADDKEPGRRTNKEMAGIIYLGEKMRKPSSQGDRLATIRTRVRGRKGS